MDSIRSTAFATTVIILSGTLSRWFLDVNREVDAPYLDEVFHVRQAQHYCNRRFDVWDTKITTPPGLYLLSYISSPILGCSIISLRSINVLCLFALYLVITNSYTVRRRTNKESGEMSKLIAIHSAMNAVLFPPLFFFSALYYTDVASTLSVFVFLLSFVKHFSLSRPNRLRTAWQIVLGIVSLMFRQTNIFWVAVAPAALALVAVLDRGPEVVKASMYRRADGFGDTTLSIVKTSWKYETIYDPPIRDAWLEDYLRTFLSISVCAARMLTQPKRILPLVQSLAPFLIIMTAFAAFIFWNGSVVLGDKSNHVATVNLPQMLYYWPYAVFFSWPLLLPYLLLIPLTVVSHLVGIAALEPLLFLRKRRFLPRFRVLLGFTLLACITVYYNTHVHPFILADNRHYVFYVFKRLLRPWWIRYAVTPIYAICAWATIESSSEPPGSTITSSLDRRVAEKEDQSKTPTIPSTNHQSGIHRPLHLPDGTYTARTSFIIVTLATTALQLVTAPLVEPRYFIVPWLIWRTHLPLRVAEHTSGGVGKKQARTWIATLAAYEYRVILETLWFLLINAVTGYIFLHRTFKWPSEPLTKMRFMW